MFQIWKAGRPRRISHQKIPKRTRILLFRVNRIPSILLEWNDIPFIPKTE